MNKPKQKPPAKTVSKQAASKTNPAPIIGKVKKPAEPNTKTTDHIEEAVVHLSKAKLSDEFSSIASLAAKQI